MRTPGRIVALFLATAALSGFTAVPAQAAPPRVAVWGDSLAYQMCGGEQQALPAREYGMTDAGCNGYSGATSGGIYRRAIDPSWSDPVIPWKPTPRFDVSGALATADVIVMSAGTNNALRQQDPAWLGYDVDNVMGLAKGRVVIWFDVGLRLDVPKPLANSSQFASAVRHDDALWAKARQYSNLRVVAWGGEVGSHREYVQDDGVHLTSSGWAARWQLIRANL